MLAVSVALSAAASLPRAADAPRVVSFTK